MEENKEIVVYNQEFALQQILEHLHPSTHNPAPWDAGMSADSYGYVVPLLNEYVNMAPEESTKGQEEDEIMVEATPLGRKKKKAKEITPIVDDEDRRSYRFKKTVLRSILWTQALKNDQWSKTRRNGGLG